MRRHNLSNLRKDRILALAKTRVSAREAASSSSSSQPTGRMMKLRQKFRNALLLGLMSFSQVLPANAADFYWDADGSATLPGPNNALTGANIGGTGTWDVSTTNWWDLFNNVVWPNTNDTAIFAGASGTVTLGAPINAGGLRFTTTGYAIAGGGNALTLTGSAPTVVSVEGFGTRATIDAQLSGTNRLVKTGNGVLVLTNSSNNYSGGTLINQGTIVFSDGAQLGTSNLIQVNGFNSVGFNGGTAIYATAGGTTLSKNLALSGRGANFANSSNAAFINIGHNNTFNGKVSFSNSTGSALSNAYGNLNVTGTVSLATGNSSIFAGGGNIIVSGLVTGSSVATDRLVKLNTGSLNTTLWLQNASNNFVSDTRIDSGTVRVSTSTALGQVSTSATSIDLNNGTLEIVTDAPDFSGRTVRVRDFTNSTIYASRAIGGTGLNQTVNFAAGTQANSTTLNITGRDGYNVTFNNGATNFVTGAGGNNTINNNSNGTLTINANTLFTSGDGTTRTFTIGGNADSAANGSVNRTGGGVHIFAKAGTGTLNYQGTQVSTLTGGTTVVGTLQVSTLGGATGGSLNGVAGGQLGLGNGALDYRGAVGTGAGETTAKVVNQTGNAGVGILLANQSGTAPSALTLTSNIGAGGNGAKNLFLGGTSTLDNTIQGVIQNNTGVSTVGLTKSGNGTWLYSPSVANYRDATLAVSPTVANTSNTLSAAAQAVVSMTNTTGLAPGQGVFGTNIPAGAFITAVNPGVSITLNTNIATAVAAGTSLTFTGVASTQTTTAASATNANLITVTSTANLVPGQYVTGANVPLGSVITSIPSATTFTISNSIATAVPNGSPIYFGSVTNFTGNVTVGSGTLKVRPTATTGNGSNLFATTQNLVFNQDPLTLNQSAGGTFQLATPVPALTATLTQTMGALTPTLGMGRVQVDAGVSGAILNQLRFNTLGTRVAGAGLNFAPATNAGIQFATAPGGLNGQIGGFAYITDTSGNIDFVATPLANTNIAPLNAATALPTTVGSATTNYVVNAPTTTTAAVAGNTVRIVGGNDLTLGGDLTITAASATSLGGILHNNGAGASTISGAFGITTSVANQELVITTGGTNPNNALTISSNLINGTGAVTKNGTGTLILSGANTFTGILTVNEGRLNLGSAGALGGVNPGLALRQNTILDLAGFSVGTTTIGGLNAFNGAGTVTNTGASQSVFRFGNSSASGLFSGSINDNVGATLNGAGSISVAKGGTGTTTLTGVSSFSGPLTITGGTVAVTSIANIGTNSAIGRGDATSNATNAASLVINGGTLQYTGSSATIYQTTQTPSVSTNRLFTLAGNATIQSSGTYGNSILAAGTQNNAALVFSNTGDIAFAGAGVRTLTLGGNSTGDNSMAIRLIDNGADPLSVTKSDGGLWILNPSSANTYSGTTTINRGALQAVLGTGISSNSAISFADNTGGVFQSGNMTSTSISVTPSTGTAAGNIGWTAAGSGGFAAGSAPLTVNISEVPTWGTTTNFLGTGNLILNSTTALSDVTLAGDFNIEAGVAVSPSLTTTAGSATVNLASGNTTGLTVGQVLGTNAAFPTPVTITAINSPTQFTVSSGTGVTAQTALANTIAAGGFRQIQVDDNGNTNTDFAIVSSNIGGTGALSKIGGGTLILSGANTYDGNTLIGGGTTIVSSIGTGGGSSNFGNATGSLNLGATTTTGNIMYVGPGETPTRAINLSGTTGGGSIESAGSGPLVINTLTNTGLGAKTLTLRGVNTDLNRVTSALVDNGGILSVTKADAGVWELTNAGNTFTGNLSINGGTLGVSDPLSLGTPGTGNIVFNNGALYTTSPSGITVARPVQIGSNNQAGFTGANSITVSSNVTGVSGNPWTISNTIASPSTLTINGNFISTETSTTRALTLVGSGNTVFNGVIQQVGVATQLGAVQLIVNTANTATTTLSGASPNLMSAAGELRQGILILDKAQALGLSAATSNFDLNGGELRTSANVAAQTQAKVFRLNGSVGLINGANPLTISNSIGAVGANRTLQNDITSPSGLTIATLNLSQDATARTLTLSGSGITNITGAINNTNPVSATASNLIYSGTGALNLSGTTASSFTGTATFNSGLTTLTGSATLGATGTLTVNQSTLTLDNTGTSITTRFGGTRAVTLAGANLNFNGNAGGTSEVTTGALTINSGSTAINVSNIGGTTTLGFGSLATGTGGTANFTGGVGTAATNRVTFTTAPTQLGGVTPATTGLLARLTVNGSAFASYNTNGNGVANTLGIQAYTAYTTPSNVNLIGGTQTLQINGSTLNGNFSFPTTANALALTNAAAPSVTSTPTVGAPNALTLTSGGILVTGGTYNLNAIVGLTAEGAVHVNSGSTLNVGGTLFGSNGFSKNLGGALNISTQQYVLGTTTLNGGTTTLSGGTNTLFPAQTLIVNRGATLDLNGNNQYVQGFGGGTTQALGGTITSAAPAIFTNNSNAVYGGAITGAITLNKTGSGTLTAESPLAYTGDTWVTGGTLTLRDNATILNTSGINLNFATLTLDNNASLQVGNNNRISDTAPITSRGGTINYTARFTASGTETLGAITIGEGASTIAVNGSNNTGNNAFAFDAQLTLASLTRSVAGSTVNFNSNLNYGTSGNVNRIVITSAPTTLANGMIGAWAIANNTDFATYDPSLGVGAYGYGGYQAYDATLASGNVTQILSNASPITTSLSAPTTLTGALRLGGVTNNDITFSSGSNVLNLELGGLLRGNQNAGSSIGTSAARGVLTAGGSSPVGTQELVIYSAATGTTALNTVATTTINTATITGLTNTAGLAPGQVVTNGNLPAGTYIVSIDSPTQITVSQNATATGTANQTITANTSSVVVNSVIADNGASPIALVKSGAGILNLSANNTYTGGTTINQGTVNLVGSGVVVPAGGLTLSGATLNMATNPGQIAAANSVTLNDSSTLLLVGNNTLNSLTFNNAGGGSNPAVTTGGVLTLSNTNALTVVSNNVGTTPTINGAIALPGAATFNIGAPKIGSQVISAITPAANIAAVVSGTGLITKTGDGVLQLSGQSTFSGGLAITAGGLAINGSSTPSTFSGTPGSGTTVTSGPLGTGLVTISNNSTIVSSVASAISNNITFLDSVGLLTGTGNTTFAGTTNITFNGVTRLPSIWNAAVQAPQQTITIADASTNLLGDVINKSGAGALSVSNYPGTINVLGGSSVSFTADGNGLSTFEQIAVGGAVNIATDTSLVVTRTGSANAFNKQLQRSSFSVAGNAVSVVNQFGYGLEITGGTTLTASAPFISVQNASASNVVQGLTLSGVVSDGGNNYGINKLGLGTLVLNGANTFGGAGSVVDIFSGVVSINSNASLGDAANVLRISVDGATGVGLRATNTFTATGRIINLAAANNAIEVTAGNVLTLDTPFTFGSPTNALVKNDNGVLEINANNSGMSGAVTINAGAIRATQNTSVGTGSITVNQSIGAALQLSGGVTIANPLTLNPAANNTINGGLNGRGHLQSVSGTNTYNGTITPTSDSLIGTDLGSTLNINGTILMPAARQLTFVGDGTTNINSSITASPFQVNKYGAGTLNFTTAQASQIGTGSTANGLIVQQGTVSFNNSGALGTTVLAGIRVNPTGTLTSDNTASATPNRLGGSAINLFGGNLNLIGNNAANVTEALGAPTFSRGYSVVTATAAAGFQTNLTFGAAANNVAPAQNAATAPSGASVLFRGSSLGTAAGAGIATIANSTGGFTFNGQTGATGTATKGILPWALVDTTASGSGVSFATTDAAAAAVGTAILRPLSAGEYAPSDTFVANNNINLTTGTTSIGAATLNINSLTMDGNAGVTIPSLVQLTSSSGGILVRGGSTSTISGGVINQVNTSSPLNVWTVGDLNISSVLTGGNGSANANIGFVKAGAGTLTLSTPTSAIPGLSGVGVNTYTGQLVINQGTLRLAGGKNTIAPNNFLALQGGTLDLNGNSQQVLSLFGDGTVSGAGGIVTSSTGTGNLVVNQDNNARSFAGSIQGNVNFTRSGQNTMTVYSPQTYNGTTLINGGTTTLRDDASLSGTTAIAINYATLNLDNNTSTVNLNNRINDAAAIEMRGSTLNILGRAQTATSEALGTISVVEGFNVINPSVGGTGVNSNDLSLASLSRPANSAATFFANGTNLGTIGSNSRITVATLNGVTTTNPTYSANGSGLTNNIVGGWAITNNEFLTYIPGLGLAPLNQTGAPQYDLNNTFIGGTATRNVRLTASTNIGAPTNVNAVSMTGSAINLTFTNASDTLNITSGGLIGPNNNQSIGATVDSGRLTAGGTTPGANSDLYIYNRANTLTVNSRIVDNVNGGGSSVRSVFTAQGGTIALVNPNNSYTGGTVLNGGTLSLTNTAATAVIPAGGLTLNNGTVTMSNFANQINSANVVTLNGGSTLNLWGNNTLAGLVFNNTGGTGTPTVNTYSTAANAGAAANGVLTIGASGIVATSSNVGTTNTIEGRVDLGASLNSVSVDTINANGTSDISPLQAGLLVRGIAGTSGGFNKIGAGVLGLAAQSQYSGPTNVNAGSIRISVANGGSRNSAYTLASGTRIDLAGNSTALGSIAGSGTIFNSAGAATLTTGFDNTSTSFSGSFSRFNDAIVNAVALNKIGTGTLSLTGTQSTANGTTGTVTVNGGTLAFSGAGTWFSGTLAPAFAGTFNVNNGGTLSLDNSSSNLDNRLGLNTAGVLIIQGGTLAIAGNSTAASTETVANLNVLFGGGRVELTANPARALTLAVNTLNTANGSGTLVVGGITGADSAPGVPNLTIANPNFLGAQGNGANGTTTMSVRHDILGDASVTGLGTGFLVRDSVTSNYRAMASSELLTTPNTATATNWGGTNNVGISASQSLFATTTANTLTFSGNSTISSGLNAAFGNYGPGGNLLTLSLSNAASSLTLAGATANVNAGAFQSTTTGTTPFVHVIAGGTLNVNSAFGIGGTAGMAKADGGVLNLNNAAYYTGTTTVNGGTLNLNSGAANTIAVVPGATTPSISAFALHGTGAVVNLNGFNQAVGALTSINPIAGMGGTVTSATPANLTSTGGGTFAGNIGDALSFTRAGNNTTTLTNANAYTGATVIRGGTLQLRDSGSILNTASITNNFGTLNVDNFGLNGTPNPTRISATTPITLQGGTLTLNGAGSTDNTLAVNTVTVTGGQANVNVLPQVNMGSTARITIDNLVRNTGNRSIVNFNGFTTNNSAGSGTLGGQGFSTNGNIVLNNLNGSAFSASNLTNNLIGGWAVANGSSFATYVNGFGVAEMGSTVAGIVAPGYDGTDITTATVLQNINDGGTARTITGNRLANSLRTSTTTSTTFSLSAASQLSLGVGWITNANTGIVLQGADNTSTLTSPNSDLYVYVNQNTTSINTKITGATALVKGGGATLGLGSPTTSLGSSNDYTLGTYVQGGTMTLNGAAGLTIVPAGPVGAGLVINNATVTQNTNAQQIAATTDVVLNGGGNLNLTTGANTLNSLTWNNSGGTGNPTVNGGTGLLTLSSAAPITANNDSLATTPVLSGAGGLALTNAAPVINTSGLSTNGLNISAAITSAGGAITKTGVGSLTLSGANTFTTGVNLNQGSLIFGAASAGTPPTITSGPVGTGALTIAGGTSILSDGTLRTVGNATTVNGDFTFGGVTAGNGVNLSGAMALGSTGRTITVASPANISTISGAITSTATGTALTKSGAGILTLSGANNFGGAGIAINGGVLRNGGAGAIPATTPLSISAGAGLDMNNLDQTLDSLSGAGFVTQSGNSTKTLTISSTLANTNFSGVLADNPLVNAASRLDLIKDGPSVQILSGANTFLGTTAINAGVLNIQNNTALGLTTNGTTVATGAALEIQGNITIGAEALSITGTGVAGNGALRNVSGTNVYGGAVTLGTGGATIQSDAGLLTVSGNIDGNTQPLTVQGSGDTTLNGVIGTTTGTLTKAGSGTLLLTGTNTYSGATSVAAGGALVAGSAQAFGVNSATTVDGTLRLAGNSNTIGSLAGGGTVENANALAATLTTGGDNTSTVFGGVIQNGTGGGALSLAKTGTGTMTLGGTNTYIGTTSVGAGGALVAGSAQAFGVNSAATISGTLTLAGFSNALGSLAGTGTVENASGTAATLTVGGDNTSTVFSGLIQNGTGGGALSLVKTGTGTQTISGANNTFSGATVINGGILLVNSVGGLGTGGVTVNAGTLGGTSGVTASAVTLAGGSIAPGSSIGTLGVGSVSGTGSLGIEYNSSNGAIDLLNVAGALDISAITLNFSDLNGAPVPLTQPFYVFANYGSLLGSNFTSISGLPANYGVDYNYLSGNQIALVSAVPEPGTLALLTVVIVGGGLYRRSRNAKKATAQS